MTTSSMKARQREKARLAILDREAANRRAAVNRAVDRHRAETDSDHPVAIARRRSEYADEIGEAVNAYNEVSNLDNDMGKPTNEAAQYKSCSIDLYDDGGGSVEALIKKIESIKGVKKGKLNDGFDQLSYDFQCEDRDCANTVITILKGSGWDDDTARYSVFGESMQKTNESTASFDIDSGGDDMVKKLSKIKGVSGVKLKDLGNTDSISFSYSGDAKDGVSKLLKSSGWDDDDLADVFESSRKTNEDGSDFGRDKPIGYVWADKLRNADINVVEVTETSVTIQWRKEGRKTVRQILIELGTPEGKIYVSNVLKGGRLKSFGLHPDWKSVLRTLVSQGVGASTNLPESKQKTDESIFHLDTTNARLTRDSLGGRPGIESVTPGGRTPNGDEEVEVVFSDADLAMQSLVDSGYADDLEDARFYVLGEAVDRTSVDDRKIDEKLGRGKLLSERLLS